MQKKKQKNCNLCLFIVGKSHTRFKVNPHSIAVWISRNSLFEAGTNLKFKWLQRDSNPQPISQLVRKRKLNRLASLAKWLDVRLRTKWLWVRIPLQSLETFTSFFSYLWLIARIYKSTEEYLYIIIMSRAFFRLNLHAIVA